MRKLTHDEQVAAIAKVNPSIEILEEITGNAVKVLCRCKICHHEWETKPSCIKSGRGCPECGKIKIANKLRLTHAEQVVAVAKVNPDIELLGEITNDRTPVLCRCKVCGHKWSPRPGDLKQRKGCPECGRIKRAQSNTLSHEVQVAAILKVNPFLEVLGKITGDKTKVLCRCKVCNHEWRATPNVLKKGCGCPECAIIKVAQSHRLPHVEHVAAINKVNPDIEILGEIIHDKTKVLCRCKVCNHEWRATPHDLKQRKGCPRCSKTGFLHHNVGKLYIMVDDLEVPTMMKIGVSINEDKRSREVLKSAHKAGVSIPALHVAKTWEGQTDLMQRIEGMMHENYAEWNIKFPTKFDGCTEFFYYTPETAGVFDVVDEIYYTVVNQF